METLYLFGDESGTHHKNDISTHYIYSCILLKEENLMKALEVRNHISKYFFSEKKVSSKSIRQKHFHRRINIIKYLVENLNFSIYTLIIDKSAITSKNLEDKSTFIKFFHNIFIRNIIGNISTINITLDSTGNSIFSRKLRESLLNRNSELVTNLFNQNNKIQYKSDDEEPLLQLADIVVGSISKIYSGHEKNDRWEELFTLLESKMISPVFFPFNSVLAEKDSDGEYQIEKHIYDYVVQNVESFLSKTEDRIKSVIVNHLLKYSKISPSKLIEIYELRDIIIFELNETLKDEQIRLQIRDLRYEGLLIISRAGKSGYKLAVNTSDVNSYFEHYLNYIKPMLQKILIAEDNIRMLSAGQTKLLDSDTLISKLISTLKQPHS
ncbi:DUF3800 domain-containing protein [Elizabethkingia anophelis]|uniref:DUF3800 domain-containing protein n=1 Tax=Elizabethkingia anophelis TaxID=1117645 RepID=UPI00099919C1|nr:DUF3800 domain-containing protein [Elizabethkingia anophelis]MCT3728147.1 DUF3800 domain-containing protein [Elizabethkingia anophelis]MDV4044706.1 DUF3800 domain-containing protein [Elizabethkingia anophelis]OPC46056.1 hypothetical protein BAY05_10705 [Elizabethkingia anophelis]PRQ86602.1 DUF3800 domain-containing protein [Elizabethkingia anophelis]PRQ88085.1 DUF3800 domain-containing protein [Elizabethkingia anophelis]